MEDCEGELGYQSRFSPPPPLMPEKDMQRLSEAAFNKSTNEFRHALRECRDSGRPFVPSDLLPIMLAVLRVDKVGVVEALLDCGMELHGSFVEVASESNAKKSMEVMLRRGWDLNAPRTTVDLPTWV